MEQEGTVREEVKWLRCMIFLYKDVRKSLYFAVFTNYLSTTKMTVLARYGNLCNNDTNITGINNHFLIEFKAHSTR